MVIEIPESGKIKIPSSVERELGLVPGTRVFLEIEDGKFVIRKAGPETPHWSEMRGMLADENYKPGEVFEDLKQERADELEHDEKRLKRLR